MINPHRHDKHKVVFRRDTIFSCCGNSYSETSYCITYSCLNVLTLIKNGIHIIVTENPKILKWYYAHGWKNVV